MANRRLDKLVSCALCSKVHRGRSGRGYENVYTKVAERDILERTEQALDRCCGKLKRRLKYMD